MPNNAGSEVRCTAQQAPLIKVPFGSASVTNITNDGDDTSGS